MTKSWQRGRTRATFAWIVALAWASAPWTMAPAAVNSLADRAAVLLRNAPTPQSRDALSGFPPPDDGGHGDFPALPPDPYAHLQEHVLPPLDEELATHGGSYLYQPEGDRLNPFDQQSPYPLLRLPETWVGPQPVTLFAPFFGTGPIPPDPLLRWPGGYVWEPQFVGAGLYQLFSFALDGNGRRRDALGHQLLLELDLRLTGTERFHVQYRPLGDGNTGGSFYQFSNPEGYVDNSTGEPSRYWFEAELHSVLGGWLDPFSVRDVHVVGGKIPFAAHNALLINDELLAVVANKNTIYAGKLSNLNVQLLYAFNDVDSPTAVDPHLYLVNVTADRMRAFYELTYALVDCGQASSNDAHYVALSRTTTDGPMSFAARALFKIGDRGGTGSGELFVVESNRTRHLDSRPLGIEAAVFYANGFLATDGWNSIAGANFNRLRTSFEVNPLIALSAGATTSNIWGAAAGVQLFRHHEDESWIPEVAFDDRDGEAVWGAGLRYLRKIGPRTSFEILGLLNLSDDPRFRREGVFAGYNLLF